LICYWFISPKTKKYPKRAQIPSPAGKFQGKLQSCKNQEARHSCLAKKTGKNACPPDSARHPGRAPEDGRPGLQLVFRGKNSPPIRQNLHPTGEIGENFDYSPTCGGGEEIDLSQYRFPYLESLGVS
jgi:hypothetical protein